MLKPWFFLLVLCLFGTRTVFSQCLTSLPPPACLGTEPLVSDNETLDAGTTKWYYGAPVTLNSLTLKGGALVVNGNLTVDKFYMDSGVIYIHPGASFVIGSGIGAGLVLKGNSAIYNYGTCEVQRNLSLDNGYATAAKPNVVVNATSTSVFRMPNQYFVINNPYSWFVNNGTAEFWGIITDPLSSPGCVCLGSWSSTRMAVLINKIQNTYAVPTGNACLTVLQYSQFYNQLTVSSGLLVCLGSGHTSDSGCIPWGCQPNNWGAAQVFTSCSGCNTLLALSMQFHSFTAKAIGAGKNGLEWQFNPESKDGLFRIERSADGRHFQPIDSFMVNDTNSSFHSVDKNPLQGNNYYMIKYINLRTRMVVNSKTVKVFSSHTSGFALYPVPFDQKFFIQYALGMHPDKIMLTDVMGHNIRIRYWLRLDKQELEICVLDKIEPGIYIIHIRAGDNIISKTIIKN